jgi:hypothetical protein
MVTSNRFLVRLALPYPKHNNLTIKYAWGNGGQSVKLTTFIQYQGPLHPKSLRGEIAVQCTRLLQPHTLPWIRIGTKGSGSVPRVRKGRSYLALVTQ